MIFMIFQTAPDLPCYLGLPPVSQNFRSFLEKIPHLTSSHSREKAETDTNPV